ncbi:hypothetical protein NDI45_01310 [Leptolyngbya sp. GB1-A1]|uniref:hypothetical protein n=1 Tax=Leptolyngbya sp. GB1-A1 TaxID=2933908 RepID=UPI003298615B
MLASLPFVFLKNFFVLKTVLKKFRLLRCLVYGSPAVHGLELPPLKPQQKNQLIRVIKQFVLLSAALVLFMTPGLAFF